MSIADIFKDRVYSRWAACVLCGIFVLACAQIDVFSQPQIATSADETTITVDDAREMEVYAFGKSVIVKGNAKGVLAFGGDVIVEGRVEGDVAAIGGSVIQKEDAFIGGDVIVFGGAYRPENQVPLRNSGKETVMFGVFEDELRELAQNPSQILAPTFSSAFFVQRLLSILFWFAVSLTFATIAPGSLSRAAARFKLSTLKVFGIGMIGFVLTTIGVISTFSFLPDYVSVVVGMMAFVLLMLAYIFGRVAMHVTFGKLIQKHILSEKNQSETLGILFGVVVWTVLLSVPYLWTFALLALFAAGIGLVLTAGTSSSWKKKT
ncbi:MAG: polymer-forming cytoskeletal protein [Pyrinomonadaceae bacterium]